MAAPWLFTLLPTQDPLALVERPTEHIQNIISSFTSLVDLTTSTWEGVTLASRGDFTALAQKEVVEISDALGQLVSYLTGCSVIHLTEMAFSQGVASGREEYVRVSRVIAALPPIPGAPVYKPPTFPSQSLAPSTATSGGGVSDATPGALALASVEAYREALVKAVDFLGAAAEGLASLPTKNVTGALESLQMALLTREDALRAAVEVCTARVGVAAKVVAPLGKALVAAQGEARVRSEALNARIVELELALGDAREALRACNHATSHPLGFQTILTLARNLSPQIHAPPHALLAQTLSAKLSNSPVDDFMVALPGLTMPVNLADFPLKPKGGGVGGEGGGRDAKDEEMGGQEEEGEKMGVPPPPPPPIVAPPQQPPENLVSLIKALTVKQRTHLLSLLPPGWKPGQPLPPHIPDMRTLLEQVRQIV